MALTLAKVRIELIVDPDRDLQFGVSTFQLTAAISALPNAGAAAASHTAMRP